MKLEAKNMKLLLFFLPPTAAFSTGSCLFFFSPQYPSVVETCFTAGQIKAVLCVGGNPAFSSYSSTSHKSGAGVGFQAEGQRQGSRSAVKAQLEQTRQSGSANAAAYYMRAWALRLITE